MKTVITEKYTQAEIASQALPGSFSQSSGPTRFQSGDIMIVPLSGQIFELTEQESRSSYPDFPDLEWEVKDEFTDTAQLLSDAIPKSGEVILAGDYDREGELISTLAVMIPVFGEADYDRMLSEFDVSRMHYSELTEDEIADAWNDREDPDRNLFEMGLARSIIDYRVGINLSRALNQCAIRGTGDWKSLSAGRVQSPLLSIVHERSQEIRDHNADEYWVPEIDVV
jgi:DNA topoisomerase IA